jgi:hypothetical protein
MVCDRVLALARGRIVLDGPVEELARRARIPGDEAQPAATLGEIVLGTLREASSDTVGRRKSR